MIRNVLGDNRAGADEGIFADCSSANNGGICAETCTTSDQGALVFIFPVDVASRVVDICEDHRRTTKNVVLELNARVQRNVILDFDVVSNLHAARYMHVLS